jgi:formylmethanofuran dehydrogenase subunit C
MRVELEFHPGIQGRVDASPLQPEVLLAINGKELDHLPLWIGNLSYALAEICKIQRDLGRMDEIVFSGDTQRLTKVGYSMNRGKLMVDGDVGDEVGVGMSAGVIYIQGNAAHFCGANEHSNSIGMQGGIIFVNGNVGDQVGTGMRRGMIIVSKNTGEYAGARMVAGTILCGGSLGDRPGLGMKRGSIVASKVKRLLPGFYLTGKADKEWLRICFTEVRRTGLSFPSKWLKSAPTRFTGDHLEMGKGEILIYDQVE